MLVLRGLGESIYSSNFTNGEENFDRGDDSVKRDYHLHPRWSCKKLRVSLVELVRRLEGSRTEDLEEAETFTKLWRS